MLVQIKTVCASKIEAFLAPKGPKSNRRASQVCCNVAGKVNILEEEWHTGVIVNSLTTTKSIKGSFRLHTQFHKFFVWRRRAC